jgi:hypothetical protein
MNRIAVAKELVKLAGELVNAEPAQLFASKKPIQADDVSSRMRRIRDYLLDIQDFVARHQGGKPESTTEVTQKEIADLKRCVGRAIDLT